MISAVYMEGIGSTAIGINAGLIYDITYMRDSV